VVWESQANIPVGELINDLSIPYIFDTLGDAVASTIVFPVGKTIHLKERSMGNGGGGTWDVVLASTVTPNGFDIVQCNGVITLAIVLRVNQTVDPRRLGAIPDYDADLDTGTDNSLAFLRAVELADQRRLPIQIIGKFLIEQTLTIPLFGLKITGIEGNASQIWTHLNGVLIEYSNNLDVSGVQFQKIGVNNFEQSRCFSTALTGQAAHSKFDRVTVNGFKYGWWHRASLWCSWSNIITKNRCGIRLSRNSLPDDQSNPDAPAGWNSFSPLGWFHNVINIKNWRAEDIEVGFMGCPMSFTLDTFNPQNQSNPNTGANEILPITEERTGLWLESGTEGSRVNFNINIQQFYAENCRRPMRIHDMQQVIIDGAFWQGHDIGSPFPTPLDVSNSIVYVQGATGQDWWTKKVTLANNAEVYGGLAGATPITDDYSTDATSRWYKTGSLREKRSSRYFISHIPSATETFVIPVVLSNKKHYRVYVGGLVAGSVAANASYNVFRWTTAALTNVDIASGDATVWTLSAVGNNLQIDTSYASNLELNITIEEVSDMTFEEFAIPAT